MISNRFREVDEIETARYRRVWRFVLLQVLGEAREDPSRMLAVAKNDRKRVISRARKWIQKDSSDLRQVCSLAGVNFELLLKYGRKKYAIGKRSKV